MLVHNLHWPYKDRKHKTKLVDINPKSKNNIISRIFAIPSLLIFLFFFPLEDGLTKH